MLWLKKVLNLFKRKLVNIKLTYRVFPEFIVLNKQGVYIKFTVQQLEELKIIIKDIETKKGKYKTYDNR